MYFFLTNFKVGKTSIVIPQCSGDSVTASSLRWSWLQFNSRLSHLPPDLRFKKKNPSPCGLLQSLCFSDFNMSSKRIIKTKYINDKRPTTQEGTDQPEREKFSKKLQMYKNFPWCSSDMYKTFFGLIWQWRNVNPFAYSCISLPALGKKNARTKQVSMIMTAHIVSLLKVDTPENLLACS